MAGGLAALKQMRKITVRPRGSIAIYYHDGTRRAEYTFKYIRPCAEIPEHYAAGKRVGVVTPPAHIRNAIEEKHSTQSVSVLHVGTIKYNLFENAGQKVAQSVGYYPKEIFDRYGSVREARGLGYLLEHACVSHLKAMDVERVRTTIFPDSPRGAQLSRVGLPVASSRPIAEWLAGMRRGMAHAWRKKTLAERVKRAAAMKRKELK
ncbi:MAG: hypothetical protein AABW54_00525 [Candidatus Micrarchaeota archaeon]